MTIRQAPEPDCYVEFGPNEFPSRANPDGTIWPAQYTGRRSGSQVLVTLWATPNGQLLTWQQWVSLDWVLSADDVEQVPK